MPKTYGKTLCWQIDGYLYVLVDIRTYMLKRGVWTVKSGRLITEIRAKSLELAKLIPLD